jgi:hypothetical protein
MEEIKTIQTKIQNYQGIEKEDNKYLIKEDNNKLMEEILKKYNQNTKNKRNTAIKKHDVSLKIIDLKKKLDEKIRLISILDNKEGSLKSKMNKNIYDKNKFIDNKNIYYIVSGIHIAILLTVFIGLLNIINSKIVIIVLIILYCIIILLLFTKYNKNMNRNKFNYNEFDIKLNNDLLTNTSDTSSTSITSNNELNTKSENTDDLDKVKSLLNNTK